MKNSVWNKKAVAIITAAALVGVLSPVSASAFDYQPDEIVTATIDLGNGNGGGGNGGGPDTCTGFSTLDLPTNALPLSYQTTRAKTVWVDDPTTDGTDADTVLDNDTAVQNLRFDQWNTQRDYVSEDFEITFDANNCIGSEDWAELHFDRLPVERSVRITESNGYNYLAWQAAEMTQAHGVLAADVLRANADLILDRGLVNGNVNSVRVFDYFFSAYQVANSDVNNTNPNDWYTVSDDLSNSQTPQGTSGSANLTAILTLFGDEAKGKYRVRYGVDMWIND